VHDRTKSGYHSQIDPLPTTGALTTSPILRARGLELGYRGAPVLSDVDLDLVPGSITALIGPNGAGKSTLLHALAGLMRPLRGTVEATGCDRRDRAYVLQSTKVSDHLPLTVRETVTMGRYARLGPFRPLRHADRAAVDAAMERLHIGDLAGRQIHELSGGQRQRAFVAQGLAQDAEVLLLDEPVIGLDMVSRQAILEAMTTERDRGRVVVVSTHELGDAARADQVVLLSGRVVARGTPDEVLTDAHLAEAYGGQLLRLGDHTLLLDDHAHH
jgi:ABC-type Mn2+/Zn2+ transport system ATPase subunit